MFGIIKHLLNKICIFNIVMFFEKLKEKNIVKIIAITEQNIYDEKIAEITKYDNQEIILAIVLDDELKTIKLQISDDKIVGNSYGIKHLEILGKSEERKKEEIISEISKKSDEIEPEYVPSTDIIQHYIKTFERKEEWETEFDINEQKTDLLNRELNRIPFSKRKQNKQKMEHKIEKCFNLIDDFQNKDGYFQNITDEYQPEIQNYINGNFNLNWLIPIVKDKKKIYDKNLDKYSKEKINEIIDIFVNEKKIPKKDGEQSEQSEQDSSDEEDMLEDLRDDYRSKLERIIDILKDFKSKYNELSHDKISMDGFMSFVEENYKQYKLLINKENIFVSSIIEKIELLDLDYVIVNPSIENDIDQCLREQLKRTKNVNKKINYNINTKKDESDKLFLINQMGDAYYENMLYNGHDNYDFKNEDLPLKSFYGLKRNYVNIKSTDSIMITNKKVNDVIRFSSFLNHHKIDLEKSLKTPELIKTSNNIITRRADGEIYYYKDIIDKNETSFQNKIRKCGGTSETDEFYLDPIYDAGQNISKGIGENKIILDWYPLKCPPEEHVWISGEKLNIMGYYINSDNKNVLNLNKLQKNIYSEYSKYFIRESVPKGFTITDLLINPKKNYDEKKLFVDTLMTKQINLLMNHAIFFSDYGKIKQSISKKLNELEESDKIDAKFNEHILKKIIPNSNNLNNYVDFDQTENIDDINKLISPFNLTYDDLTVNNIHKYKFSKIFRDSIYFDSSSNKLINKSKKIKKSLMIFFEQTKLELLELHLNNSRLEQKTNFEIFLENKFKNQNPILINKFIEYLGICDHLENILNSSSDEKSILDILKRYSVLDRIKKTYQIDDIDEIKDCSKYLYDILIITKNGKSISLTISEIEIFIKESLFLSTDKSFLFDEIVLFVEKNNKYERYQTITNIIFGINKYPENCFFNFEKKEKKDLKKKIERVLAIYGLEEDFLKNHLNHDSKISSFDSTILNIKTIISRHNDSGYLFDLLENYIHNCVLGNSYRLEIENIAKKKHKSIKGEIVKIGDIVNYLDRISQIDLNILERRCFLGFKALQNYLIRDYYGLSKKTNIVKIYSTLEDLQEDQGIMCISDDGLSNVSRNYELIYGLLLENRMNNKHNLENEYFIKQNLEKFQYTEINIDTIIENYRVLSAETVGENIMDKIRDYDKVNEGDYCIVLEESEHFENVFVRKGFNWYSTAIDLEKTLLSGKQIDILKYHIDNSENLDEILEITHFDLISTINYFKRCKLDHATQAMEHLVHEISNYKNISSIFKNSRNISIKLNDLDEKINKLISIYENEEKIERPLNIVESKKINFEKRLLKEVFSKFDIDIMYGLSEIKKLITSYGKIDLDTEYVTWRHSGENMLCGHWHLLANLYETMEFPKLLQKLEDEYGSIGNGIYCRVCGSKITEEKDGEIEGFTRDSKPIIVREAIKYFVDLDTSVDFIKTEFQQKIDNFVLGFLQNINVKIIDEHRKFIIEHLDRCNKEVKSFEDSNIFDLYKSKKNIVTSTDPRKIQHEKKIRDFLKKKYFIAEQEFTKLFGTKNIENITEANKIIENIIKSSKKKTKMTGGFAEIDGSKKKEKKSGRSKHSRRDREDSSGKHSRRDREKKSGRSKHSRRDRKDSSGRHSRRDREEKSGRSRYSILEFKDIDDMKTKITGSHPLVHYLKINVQMIKLFNKEKNKLYLYNIIAGIYVILQTAIPDYNIRSIGSERETKTYFGISDFYDNSELLQKLLRDLLLKIKKTIKKSNTKNDFVNFLQFEKPDDVLNNIIYYIFGEGDDAKDIKIIHNLKKSYSLFGITKHPNVTELYEKKMLYRSKLLKKEADLTQWDSFRPFHSLSDKVFPIKRFDETQNLLELEISKFHNSVSILILLNNYLKNSKIKLFNSNRYNCVCPNYINVLKQNKSYMNFLEIPETDYDRNMVDELQEEIIQRMKETELIEEHLEKHSENFLYPLPKNKIEIIEPLDHMNFNEKLTDGMTIEKINKHVSNKIKNILTKYDVFVDYDTLEVCGSGRKKCFLRIDDKHSVGKILTDNSEKIKKIIESQEKDLDFDKIKNEDVSRKITNMLGIVHSSNNSFDILIDKSKNFDISNQNSKKSELEMYFDNLRIDRIGEDEEIDDEMLEIKYRNLLRNVLQKINDKNLVSFNGKFDKKNDPVSITVSNISKQLSFVDKLNDFLEMLKNSQDDKDNLINPFILFFDKIVKKYYSETTSKFGHGTEAEAEADVDSDADYDVGDDTTNMDNLWFGKDDMLGLESQFKKIKYDVLETIFGYEGTEDEDIIHRDLRHKDRDTREWCIDSKDELKDFLDFNFDSEEHEIQHMNEIHDQLVVAGLDIGGTKEIILQKFPKKSSKKDKLELVEKHLEIENEIRGRKNIRKLGLDSELSNNTIKYIRIMMRFLFLIKNNYNRFAKFPVMKYESEKDRLRSWGSFANEEGEKEIDLHKIDIHNEYLEFHKYLDKINEDEDEDDEDQKEHLTSVMFGLRQLFDTDLYFINFSKIYILLSDIGISPNNDYNELDINKSIYKQSYHRCLLESIFYLSIYKIIEHIKNNYPDGLPYLTEIIKKIIFKQINEHYKYDIKTSKEIISRLDEEKAKQNEQRRNKFNQKNNSEKNIHRLKRESNLGKYLVDPEEGPSALLEAIQQQEQQQQDEEKEDVQDPFAFDMEGVAGEDDHDEQWS